MPTPTAPSFFVDVYSVTYTPAGGSSTPINIFGVKSIGVDRQETILKGQDNNKLRPVSAHTVGINDVITIDSEDGNGIVALMTSVGQGTLAFNWRASAHNVTTGNQLADQVVTIVNLVWEKKTFQQPEKGFGTLKLSGFVMEASAGDGTDPISFAVAGSPASTAAN